jgi:8-oxo-dGTP diphosphatase
LTTWIIVLVLIKIETTLQQSSNINPHVSVDCVIFGFDFNELKVLLIERNSDHDNKFSLALPGDLIHEDENLDEAARRVLKELTGLENIYLEQFHSFGDPDRVKKSTDADWLKKTRTYPFARVITIAYYSLVKLETYKPLASSFAKKAEWHTVSSVPQLAFDHNIILNKALETLRNKLDTGLVGFELLPKKFTLGQLQKLYEAILNTPLDKRNFRRKILSMDYLIPLREKEKNVAHKPASYYKLDLKAL